MISVSKDYRLKVLAHGNQPVLTVTLFAGGNVTLYPFPDLCNYRPGQHSAPSPVQRSIKSALLPLLKSASHLFRSICPCNLTLPPAPKVIWRTQHASQVSIVFFKSAWLSIHVLHCGTFLFSSFFLIFLYFSLRTVTKVLAVLMTT